MKQFYHQHNPSKIAHVDVFLRRYKGVENGIIQAIQQKYGQDVDLRAIERAISILLEAQTVSQASVEQQRTTQPESTQKNALTFFSALIQSHINNSKQKPTNSKNRQSNHTGKRQRQRRPCHLGILTISSTRVSAQELFALHRIGILGNHLCVLQLRGCECQDPGAKTIASFLQTGVLSGLVELDLSFNGIEDSGGCALVKMLGQPEGANIASLDLTGNQLGWVCWLYIYSYCNI